MKLWPRHSKKRRIFDMLLLLTIPLLFYSCVDEMIFHPPACSYRPSTHIVMIPVVGNQQIAAYYLPAAGNAYTILYSHGNAEDIGHLRDFVQYYHLQDYGVLAYDYRGYGLSGGKPSEQNTYRDIQAAWDYLVTHENIDPAQIIIHGRSVGSGPSVGLTERHTPAGLILESPFVSVYRVMTRVPVIPFDKFDNLSRIKNIHCPILIMHGRKDRVVPFWHGQTLYEAANDPKTHLWVDNAGHNDLVYQAGESYWQTIDHFKEQLEIQLRRTP